MVLHFEVLLNISQPSEQYQNLLVFLLYFGWENVYLRLFGVPKGVVWWDGVINDLWVRKAVVVGR